MSFSELFSVFSRRTKLSPSEQRPITESFRNRVLMRCRDVVGSSGFWEEIQSKLAYLHGRPILTGLNAGSPGEDAIAFLHTCEDAYFLDFLEYVFQTKAYSESRLRGNLVKDFNAFLRQDDLPYAVTDFVWSEQTKGRYLTATLVAKPQVIRKDSDVLYQTAIQPVLKLLRDPDFHSANKEFLEALEDFRRSDYGDCLTKCGSAFESVLKVLCARNRWSYSETDTASSLLTTVVTNSSLETFFEQPLILVATIRNRLSKSHGAGLLPRDLTEAKAEYAINATASAILLLVNTCR